MRDFTVLFLLTFVVILPLCCKELRHTPYERFFPKNETEEKNLLIRTNEERFNYSLKILRGFDDISPSNEPKYSLNLRKTLLSQEGTTFFKSSTGANSSSQRNGIAITIITVSRNKYMEENYKPYYLVQTVAHFLKSINETVLAFPLHFSVCNVDTHPFNHVDMTLLPKWIPIFQRFKLNVDTAFSYDAMLNKEKEDYMFCLEKAMEQNMSYSLLVEDDALPHRDLFSVIASKLSILSSKRTDSGYLEDVLFLKLYHPERLLGYISLEWERIPELLSLAGLLTTALAHIYSRWRPNAKLHQKTAFFILFLYSVLILLLIGRQNLLPLRRISRYFYQMTPAPSCCTPAMLYPRAGAKVVLDYLKTVQCKKGFGKDMAVDKLVRDKGLSTRFIQPNLFQHIGHFSAIRTGFINPFLVQ